MTFTHAYAPTQPAAGRSTYTISTGELRQSLGEPGLVIVDARPTAAYNGWRLQGEERGGHLPGAVSLPLSWTKGMAASDLKALLASKGVSPDKAIVVYGSDSGESAALTEKLHALGYPKALAYNAGFGVWAADERLPVERLPRYEKLITAEWLHRLINGGQVEAQPANRYVIGHVNFGVPEEYADGHIPGALYLDTNDLESRETWNRRTPEELKATLLAHGLTHDTTVILYGRDTVGNPHEKWPGRRAGQISAARAAMILMYSGVEDVRLLDGGYDAWVAAGYEIDTEIRQPTPVAGFGATIPARPQFIIDLDEAKALVANPAGALVSIRTWEEHVGNVSGYNYIGPSGRIPGSVWGNCGSDAYHMQHYRNADNTMRPYPEIDANWQEGGITRDKQVSFYCGTGWRASESFFYAYLMGWDNISVYDGGWFEWSGDPSNPVDVGVPR